jgi:hypothetical protein
MTVNNKSNNAQVSLRYNKETYRHIISIGAQKINNTVISSPTPLSLSIKSFQLFPNDYTFTLKPSQFPPLSLAESYIMSFKPTLVIDENNEEIDLNIRLERLEPFHDLPFLTLQSDEKYLFIEPRSKPSIVRIEKTKKYDRKYIKYKIF